MSQTHFAHIHTIFARKITCIYIFSSNLHRFQIRWREIVQFFNARESKEEFDGGGGVVSSGHWPADHIWCQHLPYKTKSGERWLIAQQRKVLQQKERWCAGMEEEVEGRAEGSWLIDEWKITNKSKWVRLREEDKSERVREGKRQGAGVQATCMATRR